MNSYITNLISPIPNLGDGLPSRCITYFDFEDFELREWFLESGDCDGKKLSQVVLNNLRRLGVKMREFLYSTKCRR